MEPLKSFLLWIAVLCLSVRRIEGECAKDQVAQFYINQCTSPVTTWDDFSMYGVQELCSKSQDIVDCIDNLVLDCRGINQDAIEQINSLIDIGRMKRSFADACSEVHARLAINSTCAMDLHNDSVECRRDAFIDYAFKIRLLQTEVRLRGFGWFETQQKVAACRYVQDLGDCAEAYNFTCGTEVYQIYHSLFTGIQISNCPAILNEAALSKERNTDGCPHNPRDAINALRRCTAPSEHITTYKDGLPTLDAVDGFCNKSGEQVASCLVQIVSCGDINPVIGRAMNRTMNVQAMLDFLDFACANENLFASQVACVNQKEKQVNNCARNEYANWLTEIQSLQTRETSIELAGGFEQSVHEATCSYQLRLKRCTVPWKFGCNFKLGEIFDSLFDSTRDPACDGNVLPLEEVAELIPVAHIGLP